MSNPLKIDYVADVSCPFCAIGLASLNTALTNLGNEVNVDVHVRPFELNPTMAQGGQDFISYLTAKGAGPEQIAKSVASIRQRAADAGIRIELGDHHRIYNTFDAHRLLAWADEKGAQLELKQILYEAYFEKGQNPADHTVLVAAAAQAGLSKEEASGVLASEMFADKVREQERFWRDQNVTSVPVMFIDGKLAVSGGQAANVFEEALRSAAAVAATA